MAQKCSWASSSPEMEAYHDYEWGKELHDEQKLFELLSLELLQAGLSWQTVLAKRNAFKEVFFDFEIQKVSQMTEADLLRLMADKRLIRHEAKLKAIINNAQCLVKLQAMGQSLEQLLWEECPDGPVINHFETLAQVPAKTELSQKITQKLKRHGFKFVGPTIVYSLMQACGLVNDHLESCPFKYA